MSNVNIAIEFLEGRVDRKNGIRYRDFILRIWNIDISKQDSEDVRTYMRKLSFLLRTLRNKGYYYWPIRGLVYLPTSLWDAKIVAGRYAGFRRGCAKHELYLIQAVPKSIPTISEEEKKLQKKIIEY